MRLRCTPLLLISSLWLATCASGFAGDAAKGEEVGEDGKKKEEKPKERPFKYSAWCAFRDLSSNIVPPLPDAKKEAESEQTRRIAEQWSGFGRRGHWTSLVLELRNTTEIKDEITYAGMASIQLNPLRENEAGIVPYLTSYRQTFEVGPQAQKQYRFSILCPEAGWGTEPIKVEVGANGRSYEVRYVQLHDLADQDFVVVVSESTGAFRHLKPRKREDANDMGEPTERDRKVAIVEPAELPSRWHDLTMADLLIIDGPPREKLSDAQWDALKTYVQAGGNILITAGPDPSRLAGPLEELAGIRAGGMVEIDSIDDIFPYLPTPRPEWKLPIVQVTVAASAKAVSDIRYNKKNRCIEMCKRYYGAGSVTFLPFSLSDKLLEHWAGRSEIPLAILEASRNRAVFAREHTEETVDVPKQATGVFNWGMPTVEQRLRDDTIGSIRNALDESFSRDTPVRMQKAPMVLSFLLLYLLCAVPGNYLLFGWFKRREVAWLAVPAWAITFSVIAYVVGYMGQTGQLTVNEVSVVEAGPGQDVGVSRTFVGLYAPRRDDYSIQFPSAKQAAGAGFEVQGAPGHLINVTQTEARNVDVPALYLVDGDAGLGIERLRVQQRSTRRLEVVHRVHLEGGVDLKVKPQAGAKNVFDVEINNNTQYALYNPVLLFEGKAIELADPDLESPAHDLLRPGTSFSIESVGGAVAWKDPNAVFFGKKPAFVRLKPHASKRVEAVHNYARERLGKSRAAMLCAWVENPVLPVAVARGSSDPSKPGLLEGVTLLVIPVPIKDPGVQIDTARRYSVRYSHDYDLNTNAGTWKAPRERTVPMLHTPLGNLLYLELQVPAEYRMLQDNRFQLQFNHRVALNLAKLPRGKAPQPGQNYSGEMSIEVRKLQPNGQYKWEALELPGLFELQADKPVKMPSLDFALDDPSIRSGAVIYLRLAVKPAGENVPFELQRIDLKASRRPGTGQVQP